MDDRPEWFDALADRFRFVREIGRGGMARVYLAEDIRLHRPVAIKVLREELAHALAHDRFLAEVRVAAELNHPNIVPLYDSGIVPATVSQPAMPWFSMMYIAGESLKERLARGPLPVGEAVDIARAVAAALDYAHGSGHGIIHRDIKPANILLAGEVATVADFGIARAIDRGGEDQSLTATGLTVGSPDYMSPEQAGADPALDHRTDVYALGCVVYQMLAGHPPFTGPNPHAIIARHNLDPPPPLGTVRPGLPPGLIAAVERALAKKPEDRWPSAGAFAHALRETAEHPAAPAPRPAQQPTWWTRRRARWAMAAVIAAVAIPALWRFLGPLGGPALDPDRYAVVQHSSADASRIEAMTLREALERWDDVSVVIVEPGRATAALEATDLPESDARGLLRRAEGMGAGHLLLPSLATEGDSILLRLALWDTRRGREVSTVQGRVGLAAGSFEYPRVAALIDDLVHEQFGGTRACTRPLGPASFAALRAFHRADSLMAEWRLRAAADTFAAAITLDPSLGPASLCRALVLSWTEPDPLIWGAGLLRVAGGNARLADRDQRILAALTARQAGNLSGACSTWRGLTERYQEDFLVHYGLADCLANDDAVVRDRRSRSGWRFRAEYGEARAAYRRAVALNPGAFRALAPGVESAARQMFSVRPSTARFGVGVAPDTGTYNAWPTLEGDTLASVPVRTLAFATADPTTAGPPGAKAAAVARQHESLYQMIAAWRSAQPAEVAALAALAEALEVRGDPTALDTLRLARRLSADPATSYRIAAAESFLMVRMGVPGSPEMLRDAAALADSLLGLALPEPSLAFERAGLAALRGRGLEAAASWREPELTRRLQVPLYLKGDAPALQVFSAIGGPKDSIRALEAQVESAIRRRFSGADPAPERMRWLALPASIAWPSYVFETLPGLRGGGDPILDAIAAATAHDSAAVGRSLRPYWEARARMGSQAVTLDGARTEAELRWYAGEREEALELLDDTLGALFGLGPGGLQDPLQAAGLVRAAALKARFAAALGDSAGARRWAEVVGLLWADPEPSAREVVRDALALMSRGAR